MAENEEPLTGIDLDAHAVRVLAHPLRSRILSRLRVHGPADATQLATALSTNTGVTSYHLRALESVGLVTDTGDGIGKRRLWRATTDFHTWRNSGFADDEDARTSLSWLQHHYVRQFADRADRWLDAQDQWPAEWVDALGLNDAVVTVTPNQAVQLTQELMALLGRYRTAGVGDARAERIHVTVLASPADLEAPGAR